jgi:hypothetical protein
MRQWILMVALLITGGATILAADGPNNNDEPAGPPREQRRGGDDDHGRPVEKIAKELGVSPEKFREVFRRVKPAPRGEVPTREQREANRKILSEGLGVSPERLDEVMDKYRPEGPDNNRGGGRAADGRKPIGENGPARRSPPDGAELDDRGRAGGPPPHNSQRFVEHALEFDADKDGKLDRDELMKFADEMGRRRQQHDGQNGRGPEPPR